MNDAFVSDVDVRFRDLDTMAHVNNAVYVSFMEQARAEYLVDVGRMDLRSPGLVVVSLSVDYRRPIEWGSDVSVAVRTTDLGTSSFTMTYELHADDEVAATGESVQVAVDDDGSRPLPTEFKRAIAEYEGIDA